LRQARAPAVLRRWMEEEHILRQFGGFRVASGECLVGLRVDGGAVLHPALVACAIAIPTLGFRISWCFNSRNVRCDWKNT
jgi:hypothetical protein